MQLAAMESHTPTSHLAGIISLCQVRCLGSINAMPPLGLVHSFRQGLPNKQLSNMGSRHLSLVLWSTCLLLLSTDAGTGARNRQSLRTGPLPEAEKRNIQPGCALPVHADTICCGLQALSTSTPLCSRRWTSPQPTTATPGFPSCSASCCRT